MQTIKADTLADLFERAAQEYSKKTAYIWRPGFRAMRFTFAEMGRLAAYAASVMEQNGVGKGDRVIIWAANSPFWVAAYHACQFRGAIAVPLMMQNTPEFVEKIVDITEAKILFKTSNTSISATGLKVFQLEETLMGRHTIDTSFQRIPVEPSDIAQILFTSGTTGSPKGVMLKHSNILSNAYDVLSLNILKEDDHLMSFLPLAHVFEQIVSLNLAAIAGVTVTQAASLAGLHIRMNMVEDKPSVMTAVPEFLKLAINRIESRAEEQGRREKLEKLYTLAPRLPMFLRRKLAKAILTNFGGKLRAVVPGGSALDPVVGDKWESFGVMVLQGYGATETSPVVAVNIPQSRKSASVGPVLPSVEVKIAEDGEILVKGPNVVDGYYKRPEETEERFKDGWYYTDDIGEFDGDGHLHIKGRKKFLIVTPAGENVYPEDLEGELNGEPEVQDSAVLALDKDGRFEIHAVLLPKAETEISDPSEITSRVNERLQPHQRIQGSSVWEGEDFPRTVTRKVKKNEVREWLMSRESGEEQQAFVPVGAVERAISVATGIPAEQIQPEKRLEADLKLDSLGRVTLVGVIEEELGVILDEGLLNESTTVEDIKKMVTERGQKEEQYEFKPGQFSPRTNFIRRVLQTIFIFPAASLFARFDIEGTEHLRGLKGPVLFLPNHRSPADGFVLKAIPSQFRSKIAIAAAADVVYENPTFKRFAPMMDLLLNTYPFARESQIKTSLQHTGRIMDRGYSVILFPEGRISMDGKLQEIRTGAGLLAVEMNAPVVPVALIGTEKMVPPDVDHVVLPKRSKVKVRFGEPMRFLPGTDYAKAAKEIESTLISLLGEDAE